MNHDMGPIKTHFALENQASWAHMPAKARIFAGSILLE